MKQLAIFLGIVVLVILGIYAAQPHTSAPQPVPGTQGGAGDIIATSSDVTLGVGQTGRIGTLSITFNSLVQDSRCPIDVQCIQAGAVNTNVTFASGSTTTTKNMPSDEVPQQFEGYAISIVSVAPARESKTEIKPGDYHVTFRAVPLPAQ